MGVVDVVAVAGFGLALLLTARWALTEGSTSRTIAVFFAAAMALYTVVSVSNALEHLGVSSALDPVEDYLEVLFVPLLAYTAHAWAADHQRLVLERANGLIHSEHELLSGIVENSLTGILVTDERGAITFANRLAKEKLELGDSEGPSECTGPGWTLRDLRAEAGGSPAPGRFRLSSHPTDVEEGVLCVLQWPDGRRSVLSVNARPVAGGEGAGETIVVAFEDVSHLEPPVDTRRAAGPEGA